MNIVDFIPKAPCEPISRLDLSILTGLPDRALRREIANAKLEVPIVNVGGGYYIATDPNDKNLVHYIMQETSRAIEVFNGIKACRKLARIDVNQEAFS